MLSKDIDAMYYDCIVIKGVQGRLSLFSRGGKDSDNVRGGGPAAEPPEKFCFPPPKFLGGGRVFRPFFGKD